MKISKRINTPISRISPIPPVSNQSPAISPIPSVNKSIHDDMSQIDLKQLNLQKKLNKVVNEMLAEQQREEIFMCLCKKCISNMDCETSACRHCSNTLASAPAYCYLLNMTFFFGLLGVLGWLFYGIITYKTSNRSYFAPCLSNLDCDSTLSLSCATYNASCWCPARNTFGRCDCNQGNYWNGTMCTARLGYLSTGCVNDYNCDTIKSLACINQTCQCRNPDVWMPNTQMCDHVYIGCYAENPLNSFLVFQTTNNNTRLFHFVDTCIDFCYRYASKFASIATGFGLTFCGCSYNYTNTTSVSAPCNQLCPSYTSSAGYYCGSFQAQNISIRSIYQVN